MSLLAGENLDTKFPKKLIVRVTALKRHLYRTYFPVRFSAMPLPLPTSTIFLLSPASYNATLLISHSPAPRRLPPHAFPSLFLVAFTPLYAPHRLPLAPQPVDLYPWLPFVLPPVSFTSSFPALFTLLSLSPTFHLTSHLTFATIFLYSTSVRHFAPLYSSHLSFEVLVQLPFASSSHNRLTAFLIALSCPRPHSAS